MLLGINNKENYCRYRACEEICLHNAITMVEDTYGFMYLEVSENKCVHCNMCKRVCPNLNIPESIVEKNEALVVVYKDNLIKFLSASGGAFSTFCKAVESGHPGTMLCRVQWDGFDAKHDIVDFNGIGGFRKSKYVMAH